MIQTTDATVLDFTGKSDLSGVELDCTVPEGMELRFAFKIGDGSWQKYDAQAGAWTDLAGDATAENVVAGGNIPEELKAFDRTALFPFIGSRVGYTIAASYDDSKTDAPVISKFNFVTDSVPCCSTIVMNEDYPVGIVDINVDKEESGGGKCTVYASVQDADGKWSMYREYHEYLWKETLAKAIRFRAAYSVKEIGKDSAKVNSVSVVHKTSSAKSDTKSVCMTKAFTFPHDISSVHMILKHPEADDVTFKPQVCFKSAPEDMEAWIPMKQDSVSKDGSSGLLADEFDYVATEDEAGSIVTLRVDMQGNMGSVENKTLGVGTGAPTLYKLEHAAIQSSIAVTPAEATWMYDFKKRALSVTAPAGSPVYISYDWESPSTYLDSMSCIFSE